MKTILKLISYMGLLLTIVPSVLVLMGLIGNDINKLLMLTGTIMWFGTVTFWMDKKPDHSG